MFLSTVISFLRETFLREKVSPVAILPTSLCTVPRDILLCIADELDLEARICLALTCRGFYACLFRRPEPPGLRLNATEKQSLLLLIEKDVPSLHFCHACIKLRPWKHLRHYAARYLVITGTWIKKDVCSRKPNHAIFVMSGYHVYHLCARLVIKRVLPLSCIEVELSHPIDRYDVKKHEAWRARIIDERLYLCSTYTIRQKRGDAQKLRQYFDSCGCRLCYHVYAYPSLTSYGPRNTRQAIPQTEDPCDGRYFIPCTTAIERCTTCQTDFEIDIAWCGHKGWIVTIAVYRMLGKCLDPSEESWRCITSLGIVYDRYRKKRDFSLPGVRETWLEHEAARAQQGLSDKPSE